MIRQPSPAFPKCATGDNEREKGDRKIAQKGVLC